MPKGKVSSSLFFLLFHHLLVILIILLPDKDEEVNYNMEAEQVPFKVLKVLAAT